MYCPKIYDQISTAWKLGIFVFWPFTKSQKDGKLLYLQYKKYDSSIFKALLWSCILILGNHMVTVLLLCYHANHGNHGHHLVTVLPW